jgi:hypothetical protein
MRTTSLPAKPRCSTPGQRLDPAPARLLRRGPGSGVCSLPVLGRIIACAVVLALGGALTITAADNPYSEIITTRNVFGLKDPPPPPAPPDTTPPVPKLTLVGIANVFGTKKAVIKTQPAPGTPPKAAVPGGPPPGQEPPLVLVEGAMQDGVTVLSIDETAGLVKVDNHGQALTLSFDKDGIKAPSGPAVPVTGQPGIPRPPGMPGLPGMTGLPTPGSVTVGNPMPGMPAIPAGMTEEMRQRFAQRYGIQAPGMPAVPVAVPVPIKGNQ